LESLEEKSSRFGGQANRVALELLIGRIGLGTDWSIGWSGGPMSGWLAGWLANTNLIGRGK